MYFFCQVSLQTESGNDYKYHSLKQKWLRPHSFHKCDVYTLFLCLLLDKVCESDCTVECSFPQVLMRMAANIYSSSHIIAGYDIERVYDEKTGQW